MNPLSSFQRVSGCFIAFRGRFRELEGYYTCENLWEPSETPAETPWKDRQTSLKRPEISVFFLGVMFKLVQSLLISTSTVINCIYSSCGRHEDSRWALMASETHETLWNIPGAPWNTPDFPWYPYNASETPRGSLKFPWTPLRFHWNSLETRPWDNLKPLEPLKHHSPDPLRRPRNACQIPNSPRNSREKPWKLWNAP